MIYLDNNSEIQRVYIPRETLNIETVVPIPDDQFSDYYTKSEVNALIKDIDVDLTDYYTKTEVDGIVDNIETTDLSDYYTKSEVDGYISENTKDITTNTNSIQTINTVTLPDMSSKIKTNTDDISDLARKLEEDYYTKEDLTTDLARISELENDFNVLEQQTLPNDRAVVSALDTRVDTIETNYVDKNGLKTINGQSIIGEGNIVIDGSGVIEGDYVEYTEFAEVAAQVTTNQENIQDQSLKVEALQTRVNTIETNYVQKTGLATINGQPLYNGGNIVIDGGGSGVEGDYVEYTEFAEVAAQVTTNQENIQDQEGRVSALESRMGTVETNYVQKTGLKTINGQSIIGEGNIVIDGSGSGVDLSDYYTKSEIDTMVGDINTLLASI